MTSPIRTESQTLPFRVMGWPTTNPLGLRGLGECGNPGLSGAIANAVCDAFRDLGVGITALPLTPRRVWEAIQQVRRHAAENGPSASLAPSTTEKRSG